MTGTSYSAESSEDLAVRVHCDPNVMSVLIDRHDKEVSNCICCWGYRKPDLSEICSNAWGEAFKGLQKRQYSPKKGKFRAWLLTVALHEIYRWKRDGTRQLGANTVMVDDPSLYFVDERADPLGEGDEVDEKGGDSANPSDVEVENKAIRRALSRMTARQKFMLEMHSLKGETLKTCAKLLGLAESTAHEIYTSAFRKVRHQVTTDKFEEASIERRITMFAKEHQALADQVQRLHKWWVSHTSLPRQLAAIKHLQVASKAIELPMPRFTKDELQKCSSQELINHALLLKASIVDWSTSRLTVLPSDSISLKGSRRINKDVALTLLLENQDLAVRLESLVDSLREFDFEELPFEIETVLIDTANLVNWLQRNASRTDEKERDLVMRCLKRATRGRLCHSRVASSAAVDSQDADSGEDTIRVLLSVLIEDGSDRVTAAEHAIGAYQGNGIRHSHMKKIMNRLISFQRRIRRSCDAMLPEDLKQPPENNDRRANYE